MAAWNPEEVEGADDVVVAEAETEEETEEESEEMREVIGVKIYGLEYIQPDLDVPSRL